MTRAVYALGLLAALGAAQAQESRFEPNQSRRAAAKIEAGSYGGLVCDAEDWYVIPVKAGHRLLVEVAFTHADGDLDIGLYDARGRVAGYSRGTAETERVGFTALSGGPLFVRVFGETNTYTLTLSEQNLGPQAKAGWEVSGCGNEWSASAVPAKEAIRCRVIAQDAVLAVLIRDADANELAAGPAGTSCDVSHVAEEAQRILVQVKGEPGPFRLGIHVGRPVPEDLTRVFGKLRGEGAGIDLLELQNGDALQGQVMNPGFSLVTAYGALSLRREQVAGIDLGTPARALQRVASVDGSRFSGFLELKALEVKLGDDTLRIPVERVKRVVFGRRGNECDGLTSRRMVVLKNDDRFSCALDGIDPRAAGQAPKNPWVLALGFADQPVNLDLLEGIDVVSADEVRLKRPDRSSLRGRLNREYLDLELDLVSVSSASQRLRIHLSRVAQILPRAAQGGSGGGLEFNFDGEELEGWEAMADGTSRWSRVAQGEDGCLHAGGANGGNYGDNAGVHATSPVLSIEGIERPVLSLRARHQLEDGADFVAILVSYDEGQTFVEAHRVTGTQPWTPIQVALEPGESVQVRFSLLSDASVNGPGAWIDDVKISDAE